MQYLFSDWDKIASRIKSAKRVLLLLDFDGTLVPIQKDPAQCYISDSIKAQLKQLADSKQCYLAILSGRALADIKKRVGIRKIYYSGTHGLDIAGPEIRYTHPKALLAKPIIGDIRDLLRKEILNIKGAWVEDKKFTVSLHFRSVKKENISVVKKVFYRTVERHTRESGYPENYRPGFPLTTCGNDDVEVSSEQKLLVIMKGKKVLELIPDASWDKGKAALYILQRLKDNCLPIYIGDDYTDETAFKALYKKGITIRIGKSKKTSANYFLKGQWEISKALEQIQSAI